jgi:hypothetical protein
VGSVDVMEVYGREISRSVIAKDNNAFWPAGIPALSYPSAHLVTAGLSAALGSGMTPLRSSSNPTAVLCLLLYLTHGFRRLGFTPEQCRAIAFPLLEHVRMSRGGTLVPEHALLLPSWRSLPGGNALDLMDAVEERYSHVVESFQLGAQAWALGESAFFFNHRLLTERHGLYSVGPGRLFSCRNIANLDLCEVWPEVQVPDGLPDQVAVWSSFPPAMATRFSYDLFANSTFLMNPRTDCLGSAVWVKHAGERTAERLTTAQVRDLRVAIAELTRRVLAVVRHARVERLAKAMADIMGSVVTRVLGMSGCAAVAAADISGPYDRRVSGDATLLSRYYDLRCDWRFGGVDT